MITPYTIDEGFFKGCTIYIDDNLPPDTMEYTRGNTTMRMNIKTGVLTILQKDAYDFTI